MTSSAQPSTITRGEPSDENPLAVATKPKSSKRTLAMWLKVKRDCGGREEGHFGKVHRLGSASQGLTARIAFDA